jgi:X-Pro dipeptidyl-peptidase
VLAAAVVAAALVPLGPAGSLASTRPADFRPHVSGDHTIPYYDLASAITETIEVETELDGDHDGDFDRITVRLTRPSQGADDLPLIVGASPYYGGDISRATWVRDRYVPKGYAVGLTSLPGTHESTGCDDVGADLEVLGTKAVVDWVQGRADAYDADGDLVKATWSNGEVGMIGKSWDGTIANAVASTGVPGLKTIVSVAAISSWYDYTRGNGIPFFEGHMPYLHQLVSNFDSSYCHTVTQQISDGADDATGNYSNFWEPRDYRLDASKITASVYVVHGLTDENVKTRQFGEWWDELEKYGVERKIFLHQRDHIDPILFSSEYASRLDAWFDFYLQGLDNGVGEGPQATIEREDGTYVDEPVWPPADTSDVTMKLSKPLGRSAGALSTGTGAPAGQKVTFTQSTPYSDDSVVSNPTNPRGDRAVFLSNTLDDPIRESGTAEISLRVKVNRTAAGFQARVVDYAGSSGYVVSRTMADLGHYKSWRKKKTLEPGKWYTLTWEINTDDRIFAAGHRLGLVVTAEQHNPTAPYQAVTATIDTAKSKLIMPLSGEVSSLDSIGPDSEVLTTSITGTQRMRGLDEFVREFLGGPR